jgi:hypothetical protein
VLRCRGPRECPPALVHAHGSPRAYKEGARMSECCFGDAGASRKETQGCMARMHVRRRRNAFDGRMRTRTRSCNFVGAIPDILISTRSLLSVSLGFSFFSFRTRILCEAALRINLGADVDCGALILVQDPLLCKHGFSS